MFRLSQNSFYGSEDEFIKHFIKTIGPQRLWFGYDDVQPEFFEQIHIPSIRRRSDLIIRAGASRLINIEFKLNDYKCVIQQAADHLRWADYSYVCFPAMYFRQFPRDVHIQIKDLQLGLLLGTPDTFIEVFRAKHNPYTQSKQRPVRNQVEDILKTKKSKVYDLL